MRRTPLDFSDPEPPVAAQPGGRPRADAGGVLFTDLSDPALLAYFTGGGAGVTQSGAVITTDAAMRVAVAYRCTHILAGACGNLPIDVYRRTSERSREVAVGHPLRDILQRPNSWQTSAEFRKMLTAHAVLKGDGYALKITSRGRLLALWPLKNPDRMRVTQGSDMSLDYEWSRDDGSKLHLKSADVLHLRGLTLDGIHGIGVIRHAREALGLSLQTETAGARLFRQGMIGNPVFSKPGILGDVAFARLKEQLDAKAAGAENAGKALILEDDLKHDGELMTAEDLQFLQTRGFQRGDVGMFFGVPPFMYGDTDKATSFGTGIETQGAGFRTWTAEDWWQMWEQSLARDCLDPVADKNLYVQVNRNALMRADFLTRQKGLKIQRDEGVISANEWRAVEDMNPRTDPGGDEYIVALNMGGSDDPTAKGGKIAQ